MSSTPGQSVQHNGEWWARTNEGIHKWDPSAQRWDRWTPDVAGARPPEEWINPWPAPVPGATPVHTGYPTYPVVQAPPTNGLAIASMVLGILWIWWIGSLLALIFGYVALNQIRASAGTQGGRGMAIAGVVLGWVGVGMLALFILFGVIAASTNASF